MSKFEANPFPPLAPFRLARGGDTARFAKFGAGQLGGTRSLGQVVTFEADLGLHAEADLGSSPAR
jgi:hypothetical protein